MPVQAPTRQSDIARHVRERIVRGDFGPGERVPTRAKLAQDLGVSTVTVQRALDGLAADGFITAMGSRGTFVNDHPPHLCNYGLIFSSLPDTLNHWSWSRFFTSLRRVGEEITERGERRVVVYSGIDAHGDTLDAARLRDDLSHQRLAGLILVNPETFNDSGMSALTDIPKVTTVHGPAACGVHSLMPNSDFAVVDRALDFFERQGRRRVAVVMQDAVSLDFIESLVQRIGDRGMQTHARWIHGVSPHTAHWGRHIVDLMMEAAEGDRPDALLIADDNLVEHATGGLIDTRVRVPDEVSVVAHCNYPFQTPSALRVTRLGFDARQIMARALTVLEQMRVGESVDPSVVEALFENEVAGPTAASTAPIPGPAGAFA